MGHLEHSLGRVLHSPLGRVSPSRIKIMDRNKIKILDIDLAFSYKQCMLCCEGMYCAGNVQGFNKVHSRVMSYRQEHHGETDEEAGAAARVKTDAVAGEGVLSAVTAAEAEAFASVVFASVVAADSVSSAVAVDWVSLAVLAADADAVAEVSTAVDAAADAVAEASTAVDAAADAEAEAELADADALIATAFCFIAARPRSRV